MANVVVGQSGGPSSVINNSLAGVYKRAKILGADKVYGMRHGIQGFLEERLVDLDEYLKDDRSFNLLRATAVDHKLSVDPFSARAVVCRLETVFIQDHDCKRRAGRLR